MNSKCPTVITRAPGTNRLFVASNNGRIVSFEDKPAAREVKVMLELPTTTDPRNGATLYRQIHGLEFHPDFERNRLVFVYIRDRFPPSRVLQSHPL